MTERCGRKVGSASCGIARSRPDHWPHRYVEDAFFDRLKHEVKLRRYGYTATREMLRAIFLKRV